MRLVATLLLALAPLSVARAVSEVPYDEMKSSTVRITMVEVDAREKI